MKIIHKENTPILKNRAVEATIKSLSKNPSLMESFIKDALDGNHKEWLPYQYSYSLLVQENLRGRPEPLRKNRGSSSSSREQTKLAWQHDREKEGQMFSPFHGILPLHKCKTPKEKVKMILASDAPPQVKADLIIPYL